MESFSKSNLSKVFLLLLIISFGCKDREDKPEMPKTEEYIMYQPSEMANFMNALYVYNEGLKNQILDGKTPTDLPLDLLTLHTAEMTKGKFRSEAWNNVVNVYIKAQKQVTDSTTIEDITLKYNEAITNCLACHKTECTGPIPRIQKLLIK